jgi:hypothetical protein
VRGVGTPFFVETSRERPKYNPDSPLRAGRFMLAPALVSIHCMSLRSSFDCIMLNLLFRHNAKRVRKRTSVVWIIHVSNLVSRLTRRRMDEWSEKGSALTICEYVYMKGEKRVLAGKTGQSEDKAATTHYNRRSC